ncbi:hypothetical protein V1512DRAFT_245434 [Lipomyces arxii]|uniref:uncharacterized protein n=1 Tax=Lipomyces arxii TaxID=56418 RepID=UPI0034CE5367
MLKLLRRTRIITLSLDSITRITLSTPSTATWGPKTGKTTAHEVQADVAGDPKPGDYNMIITSSVLIVFIGDWRLACESVGLDTGAAYLCNFFGGLGLTGGSVDVDNLYDWLIGVYRGVADQSMLKKYGGIRRQKLLEAVDPTSSDILLRMHQTDSERALKTDKSLKLFHEIDK